MYLELVNFRKHEKLEVEFGKFTLLKGSSGQGKSTLFQAIYWCFFGSLRCVHPSTQPKVQTKVTYRDKDLTIVRSRNPKYLTLTLKKKIYKEVEAQGIINAKFGEKNLWLATSYLLQGQDHPLLERNNSSSLELLNSLAFSGEDPRALINKITSLYKEEETFLLALRKKVEDLHASLEPKISQYEEKKRKSKECMEKLQKELEEKKKELPLLQSRALKEKEDEGMRNSLLLSLNKVIEEIASFPPSLENREELEKKKKTLQEERDLSLNYWKTLAVYSSLEKEIILLSPHEIKGDLYKISSYVERYTRHLTLATKLSISYEKEVILSEKKRLEDEIAQLLQLEEENKLRKKLYQQLAPLLPAKKFNFTLAQVQEEIFTLKELVKQKEALICPHCQKEVSYWKGELIKRVVKEEEVAQVEKRLKEKETLLSSIQEEEKRKGKRKIIQAQLKQLCKEGETGQLEKLRSRLSSLEKIEFLEKPKYSLQELELAKRLREAKDKLPRLPPVQRKLEEIEEELLSLTDVLIKDSFRRKAEEKKEELEKRLASIQLQGLEKELIALTKRVAEIEEEISSAKFHNKLFQEYQEFKQLEKEYEEKYSSLLALGNLKKNALKAERMHLENVVQTCNFVLEKVTGLIFDEPICARLQLEKQLKNGLHQHRVNFYLNYRGVEGEIDQLSGGEKQRMSLALVLALAQFSNGPLLLDECLAFLDADLQEASLEAIREFNNGKSTVYIGHNVTEGYFSSLVSL